MNGQNEDSQLRRRRQWRICMGMVFASMALAMVAAGLIAREEWKTACMLLWPAMSLIAISRALEPLR